MADGRHVGKYITLQRFYLHRILYDDAKSAHMTVECQKLQIQTFMVGTDLQYFAPKRYGCR